MDEWSKQLLRSFEAIAHETEQWFEQVSRHLADASDSVVKAGDEWAEQMQQAIEPDLERMMVSLQRTVEPLAAAVDAQVDEVSEQINQVIDPVLNTLVSGLGQWIETVSAPINSTVEPILQNHPACVGCRHYCGQAYGGNLLVCAMHPYGPEAAQCSDWASIWPESGTESEHDPD